MAGETQSGMQCVEAEGLLAEALDGTLHGATLAAFEAHQQSCTSCRTMLDEAKAGMHWLQGLEDAEPPRNLVHNILAQTIGALPSEHAVAAPRGEGWFEKLRSRLIPALAPLATPRFAMSFGMAFFSITMLLGIAGFHFADVRHWDLSSKGIRKTYYTVEVHVVRYYENMRLVYEIESRVRDLRHAATPDNNQDNQQQQQQQQQEAPAPNPKNPSKSENRQQQDRNQQNYSREDSEPELAAFPAEPRARVELPVSLNGRSARVMFPVDLKGRGFSRAVAADHLAERALAREAAPAIPQARRQGPQQTRCLSLLGRLNRRTA